MMLSGCAYIIKELNGSNFSSWLLVKPSVEQSLPFPNSSCTPCNHLGSPLPSECELVLLITFILICQEGGYFQ